MNTPSTNAQNDTMNETHRSDDGDFGLSSPNDSVVHSTPIRMPSLPQQYWTPANNVLHPTRTSEMPQIPDSSSSTLDDEFVLAPPQIQGALVSPPRPRFHLSMRPLSGRSNSELGDWTLEVRVPPSNRALGPTAVSFLPIPESPCTADTSTEQLHSTHDAMHRAQSSNTVRSLPFLLRRNISSRITDEQQQSRLQVYPNPPSNVFFPQF
ncbi:hypothetical protein IV203_007862 [Nitzschia inconspicua]|uniref:Uncharacterized protein n=1 Tax=Nitzschia inconspicua TaxID=303405 RepID=A0A9K3KXG7_9STRA|nr:hypothetical protein IV203_007862 [Nitzschia inconspicua]